MIELHRLTKRYGEVVAVDDLSLTVPTGEIAVLVGPSGCGKTTTLEMINRLVEPTSGRIVLDGDDVTHVGVDQLRRRIGYVMQGTGLFPHRTIAENVATVPRLLDWPRERIRARVDELLELVGLDPPLHRTRYPRELSGGQQQRVGVARALAGDPPVLLMDEPFAATDPITREGLQAELLRIQSDVRKTIVFVTHDIDEAITLGDRIALLQAGSRIAQYDTPEHLLSAPADTFVEDFLGGDIVLKRLQLARIDELEVRDDWRTLSRDATRDEVQRVLNATERDWVLLVDADRRPVRWARADDLRGGRDSPDLPGEPIGMLLGDDASLQAALQEMLISTTATTVVVDEAGRYRGVLTVEDLNAAVRAMRSEAQRGPALAGAHR